MIYASEAYGLDVIYLQLLWPAFISNSLLLPQLIYAPSLPGVQHCFTTRDSDLIHYPSIRCLDVPSFMLQCRPLSIRGGISLSQEFPSSQTFCRYLLLPLFSRLIYSLISVSTLFPPSPWSLLAVVTVLHVSAPLF